jgi:hypothetical protein
MLNMSGGSVTITAGTSAGTSGGSVTITGGIGGLNVKCPVCDKWLFGLDPAEHASKYDDDLHKTMSIVDS